MLFDIYVEPGPPESLQITPSGEAPDEFILQWDMPRNPNGAILGYKVITPIVNLAIRSHNLYNICIHILLIG